MTDLGVEEEGWRGQGRDGDANRDNNEGRSPTGS
jgi:hypothetical protein